MKPIDAFLTEISRFLTPTQVILKNDSPEECAHFAQDWSGVLTPNASAVIFPISTDEVSKILTLASRYEIPVVPSGGRTGLSGGAVAQNGEVVLSLIRLNFIKNYHPGALTVRVGAGAITQAVHEYCEAQGVTWPVDFASKGSSTVGGNIATNAGGVRVIRYGNTRNWVLGLTAVRMDGTIHHFNSELEKNNTGYDFRQLMIGSEGTLGVITEATLKLSPLPQSRTVFFFALADFTAVIKLFEFARSKISNLSAFECMDHACLSITTNHFQLKPPVKPANAFVLMEVENAQFETCEQWLSEIFDQSLVLDGVMAQSEKEAKELWHYREGIAEAILADHSVHQEDVSVPVAHLSAFYSEIHARYQKAFGEQVFFFGHIGDGNLHIFVRGPQNTAPTETRAEFLAQCKAVDLELFQVLQKFNGSVSAEHGIGVLKRHAIQFTRSPSELKLMENLKSLFDPKGLLNPGKLLSPHH